MKARFELCPLSLERYQELRLDQSAERIVAILPLATILWSDEYPKGEIGLPRCHPQCGHAFGQLLLARHEIWTQGSPARERKKLWQQARKALPEWPGFARSETSTELRDAIRIAEDQHRDFFQVLAEWADTVEISPGKFTATKKL